MHGRLIIIDESLTSKLARELSRRGHRAASHRQVKTTSLVDPHVLDELVKLSDPWVLVAADDKLPFAHPEEVAKARATIATLDGDWKSLTAKHGIQMTEDQFNRDAVHRWAHVIKHQEEGQILRYTPWSYALWRPKAKWGSRPA